MALKAKETPPDSVDQDSTRPLPSFTLFFHLPPELRLKIWNLNLPVMRLVSLNCGGKSPSLKEPTSCATMAFMGCTSDAPVPVNLHVCAESRADALKTFRCAFGFARMPGHVFFNPESDILYFGPREGYMAADAQFHTCMTMCDRAHLAAVRRIAISDALFWVEGAYNSLAAASLTVHVIKQLALRMPFLEQVLFVPREQDEVAEPILTERRMKCQVRMAMQTACLELSCWRPPSWAIVSLRTLSSACR